MVSINTMELLPSLGFIFVPGNNISLGTKYPIVCPLEGSRRNETPIRIVSVASFWINQLCVSNDEFEKFNPNHHRPATSASDKSPVTDITYLEAINYAKWFSDRYGLDIRLPTEAEWVLAAAPIGWEFTYKRGPKPKAAMANNYSAQHFGTLAVNDDRYGANYLGLYHIDGNVNEMTAGWHYAPGTAGAETDGAYCILKGGDFGHCDYSAGIQRRMMFDVSGRSTRVGMRLACSDYIEEGE